MADRLSASGLVGERGRLPAVSEPGLSHRLVLGGQPLPLVARLRTYTCGITPYDVTHLGHAAVFVWADLLRSVGRLLDVTPHMVRNVTDVDDVLTTAASGADRPYDAFALAQEFAFDQDMRAVGVADPDVVPRARGHVGATQQLAAALLASDRAYVREGHVVFRGADVVARSGLERDAALAASAEFGDQGVPVERDHPFDVLVWRPSGPEHPAWPSPWGWGRPGWHAECAAMALAASGPSVDVLVGGADLAFPHHAYQGAMIEAATGVTPFARRHLHVGTVGLRGAKMAKSTGNLVMVRDLLARHPGPVVRLLLLNRPWAEPWDFTDDRLSASADLLDRLYVAAGTRTEGDDPAPVVDRLCADLDVPGAVDAALTHRGEAARTLLHVLKLTDGTSG